MADRRLAGPWSELGAWECILYETANYVDTGATASLRERSGVSLHQTQPNAAQKSQITATAADRENKNNSELHRNIQYANFVNQIQMIYIENSNETFIWIFLFLYICLPPSRRE